ncbi:aminoglycoside phosphotransferase family protein [Luteimonas sp. e5]
MFEDHLRRWRLHVDGELLRTPGAVLLPARSGDGKPVILKHVATPEERAGLALLQWWNGDGAVRVLARDGDVVLMVRATGKRDLLAWALHDARQDSVASTVLCTVLSRLHAARPAPLPALQPLAAWFDSLRREAGGLGEPYPACAELADALLASARCEDIVPLHGDCHHRNVLDFGEEWLAIDPKDRIGERAFDYAQILCNPDLPHAADPTRFASQLARVAACANIAPERLARWTAACAALSGVWFLEDGDEAQAAHDAAIARTALAWLGQQAGRSPR